VPEFAVFDEQVARKLLRAHGAVVVKPRTGAGSEHVSVIRSEHDPQKLVLRASDPAALEVEEFIDGPLFHVDSVVEHGRVVAATAGRYMDPTTSYQQSRPLRGVAVPRGRVLEELLAFNERVVACYPRLSRRFRMPWLRR
jgi:hypothetical protein